MKEISIIVPVYNVEKYVKQCLDSLIAQTFTDYEIIVVDDGSTDHSYEICKEYERHSCIKLYHRENHGVSQTRQFGVSNANGRYVLFVDSDDYVEPTFCERMYHAIQDSQAEIAECNYSYFTDDKVLNTRVLKHDTSLYNKSAFRDRIFRGTIVNGSEAVVVWNKIYQKAIIDTFVSDYGESLLEDYLFNLQYYQGVCSYCYIDEVLIHYRKTAGSLTKKPNPRAFEVLKSVQKRKESVLRTMGITMETDQINAARWFVNYSYEFLRNWVIHTGKTQQTERLFYQVCSDQTMQRMCGMIKDDFSFARDVSEGKIEKEYRKMCRSACRMRVRCLVRKYLK